MSGGFGPERRGMLLPGLFACAGLVVLIALGSWQLERRAWKEGLIETIERRLAAPPVALPTPERWPGLDPAAEEFRHVNAAVAFMHDQETLVYTSGSALRGDVSGPGFWVFTPARVGDAKLVVVNRGFVPEANRDPKSRAAGAVAGLLDIDGVMRWPEAGNWFTPAGDVARNIWFARDHLAMAAARGWQNVAPFYLEQESPVPPGGLPHPGKLTVKLPNNHLQYAITWFGLAIVLLGVFTAFVLSERRKVSPSR